RCQHDDDGTGLSEMPAEAEITSDIPCAAETLWRAVHDPQVLVQILKPLVSLKPVKPAAFPEEFVPATYVYRMKAFGFFPLGLQSIHIEHPPPEPGESLPRFLLKDHGSGQIARVWNHTITIVPISDHTCRYTDKIEIEAGLFTAPVLAFARTLFRHRQRRLK